MKYLISEVEFYKPTVKGFLGNIVVLRRDQLLGENIYVAPKDFEDVAASFSGEENSIYFPNFADIIIFIKAINFGFSLSKDKTSITVATDKSPIVLTHLEDNKVLMQVSEFEGNERSFYDFLTEIGIELLVATTLPKTLSLDSTEGDEAPEVGESEVTDSDTDEKLSKVEAEAVIEDSKDDTVPVEVVDKVEEMIEE